MYQQSYLSPIGPIAIYATIETIVKLSFEMVESKPNSLTQEAVNQLQKYFAQELTNFELPIEIFGTPFQQMVYKTLLTIPYGETITYNALSHRIGNLAHRSLCLMTFGRVSRLLLSGKKY